METIQVRALAASKAKGKLEPFEFSLGSLGTDQVDIKVQYCGICHSDLTMLDNDFGLTQWKRANIDVAESAVARYALSPRLNAGRSRIVNPVSPCPGILALIF